MRQTDKDVPLCLVIFTFPEKNRSDKRLFPFLLTGGCEWFRSNQIFCHKYSLIVSVHGKDVLWPVTLITLVCRLEADKVIQVLIVSETSSGNLCCQPSCKMNKCCLMLLSCLWMHEWFQMSFFYPFKIKWSTLVLKVENVLFQSYTVCLIYCSVSFRSRLAGEPFSESHLIPTSSF